MKKTLCLILVMILVSLAVSSFAEKWTCPGCGKESEGNFCPWCGEQKPRDKVICPFCGAEYDPESGFVFCSKCGTRIADTEAAADNSRTAAEPILIRQEDDNTFAGGTMMTPESYPEIRLIRENPRNVDILTEGLNTVSFPLPENTVPDKFEYNKALVIDSRDPDCKISYEYILHKGTELKYVREKISSDYIVLRDDSKAIVFLIMGGCRAHAYLYLEEANLVLEIVYRVVDWDAYPADQMREVLINAIQKEQERVLAAVSCSHTDAGSWWTLGTYSGISMLDGDSENQRVNIVFPEMTIEKDGQQLTGLLFPYEVGHNKVRAYVFYAPETGCDFEFEISRYNVAALGAEEKDFPNMMTLTLNDGNEWTVKMYRWAENHSTTFITLSRWLHNQAGYEHDRPSYLTVYAHLDNCLVDSETLEGFLNTLASMISYEEAE